MTSVRLVLGALLVAGLVAWGTGGTWGRLTVSAQQAPVGGSCDRLSALALPNTTITLAQTVAAGQFAPPVAPGRGGAGRGPAPALVAPAVPGRVTLASANLGLGLDGGRKRPQFSELPGFCRVAATVKPTPSSDIRMEVWLPVSGWNGRFRGTVANGMGGNIAYASMAAALRDGFAVASSDTGHQAADPMWMQDSEKMKDFGYRAAHEMTVVGKAVTEAFYTAKPKFAYIGECGGASTSAMSEAQKYPGDYDGIIVGGLAAYWTRQVFGQAWVWQATHQDEASFIPPAKYPAIHDAVLQACDALDGVKDGVLENPARCTWDPQAIACKDGDGPTCLTAPQVEAVRKIYAGPTNPRTKEAIHSPLYRGSELDWEAIAAGQQPIAVNVLRTFVFKDPMWDIRTRPVNFDSDVALADRPEVAVLNAMDPDVSKFAAAGGKLILTGGWANAIVPPGAIVDYYKKASATLGKRATDNAVRLYMVPGMSECNGGPGTDTFDMMAVMQQWVEQKKAPKDVTASRVENGTVVRTRPLCPYPQVATYKGKGSTDAAENFVCR